jgi:hypothetical protein
MCLPQYEYVALPPGFRIGYAVVLALLAAAAVLRLILRPRAHPLFRVYIVAGSLLAFGAALLWDFPTVQEGAWMTLDAAAIATLALYGEIIASLRADKLPRATLR